MDQLQEGLGAILKNPEMMQKIMALAQDFERSGPGPEAPPCKQEEQAAPPPAAEVDMALVRKLMGIAGRSRIDADQQRLLKALEPYLSRQRLVKLERAMQAAKMTSAATALLGASQGR